MEIFCKFLLIFPFSLSLRHNIVVKLHGKCCRHSLVVEESFIDLTSDQGIKKELITPGQGRKVETGDILAVEYSARIVGDKVFAAGDKKQFILKDGTMIKGWDLSVSSMQVGEKAKFVVNSKYGYGIAGVPPVIPGNADLELTIKVLAWLGNQLRPETLFQKDLDIDPFISSSPEAIQADYDELMVLIIFILIVS